MQKVFEIEEIIVTDKKTGKKQIKTIYKPKYKDDTKKYIYAPLTKKYLEAQPEEIVRQEFICKLINDYGYSLEQMAQEIKLTSSQRGTGRASADLVIWKTAQEKKQKKIAFLVCEFKADYLKLKVEDCYQGYNYATWSRAKLFAISNGKVLQVYKTIEEELPLQLQPVNDIPKASDILDDKKLNQALAKTKEFTGDEFAKLLHKCHNIIRNNDKLSPEASFDEISKILFIKIMYERNPKQEAIFSFKQFQKQKEAWNMVKGASENETSYMQRLFEDVKSDKWFKDANIFDKNEKIKLRERSFEQIVKELEIYNLTATSADVKGIAFEKFLGRTFRGELGQFFTPRVIVDFIINVLDPKEDELICDPCAGSGGFLIKAFETIKDTIDTEFINIKKVKQKEIFGENLENIEDEELQKEYDKFLEDINKIQEDKIIKLSHKSIYGTDANPRMARVSKMNMIMHGDGHNGIHHNDGLLNINGIFRDRFDVIVTNPPFGTTLDKKYPTVEEDEKYNNIDIYVKQYQEELYYRTNPEEKFDIDNTDHYEIAKQEYIKELGQVTDHIDEPIRELFKVGQYSGATEVLFIERCLDLLKVGGRMGIVLPEGVLNSSNLVNAREYFSSRAKILLIVSLPQDIFISSGATVKTSLVFFKKFTTDEKEEYETIVQEVTTNINKKYASTIEEIKSPLQMINEDIENIKQTIKELIKAKKEKDANKVDITKQIEDLKVQDKQLKEQKKEFTKEQKKKLKEIEQIIETEIKEQVKEKFDYEIPIADIQKAGITTTGAVGENQLPKLLEVFTQYRKENKLWDIKK